jgi:quercetin dioxygenase-like cupin family protein
VVSGRFRFWLGEQLLELGAGDTLSIAGNLVHGAEALEAGELLDVFSPIRQDLLG